MTNSHILVQEFDYLEPASLEEAVALLDQHGDEAQLLAGGTYLLVQMKMERRAVDCLISIAGLPGLGRIETKGAGLNVGAGATIRSVGSDPMVHASHSALADACAAFGSTQIQVMGTLGGNLCSGSPASDTVPALLALDARAALVGPSGERVVPVEELLVGPGQTALRRGELLRSIYLPSPAQGTGSAFIKVSRVRADLAKASVAATLVRHDERVIGCRLAFGSVGPTVLRIREAEEALAGQAFSAELALEAGRIASQGIRPIDDVRSSAWYRREVIKALTHDALLVAWERAGQVPVGRVADWPSGGERGQGRIARSGRRIARDERREITLRVNGQTYGLAVRPNELLLNVLRERLQLTGTKYGCGVGECGACTVYLDGEPALACLTLAVAADGREVTTVEGLQGPNGELDVLQEAFIEHAAFQCGYCTPGMLMMTRKLLDENPSPSEADVRDYIKGNRCRCTGFASIVRAVLSCAQADEEAGKGGRYAARV
jgi:carbon-monoxide dehydrogenase medium subunit